MREQASKVAAMQMSALPASPVTKSSALDPAAARKALTHVPGSSLDNVHGCLD